MIKQILYSGCKWYIMLDTGATLTKVEISSNAAEVLLMKLDIASREVNDEDIKYVIKGSDAKPDFTTIGDLLDVVHFAIIKKLGENTGILTEMVEIDKKLKEAELNGLKVEGVAFWENLKRNFR